METLHSLIRFAEYLSAAMMNMLNMLNHLVFLGEGGLARMFPKHSAFQHIQYVS